MAFKKLTINVSESTADTIQFEASLAGISPSELFRQGVGLYIVQRQIDVEIRSMFDPNADVRILPMYVATDLQEATPRFFVPTKSDAQQARSNSYQGLIEEIPPTDLL